VIALPLGLYFCVKLMGVISRFNKRVVNQANRLYLKTNGNYTEEQLSGMQISEIDLRVKLQQLSPKEDFRDLDFYDIEPLIGSFTEAQRAKKETKKIVDAKPARKKSLLSQFSEGFAGAYKATDVGGDDDDGVKRVCRNCGATYPTVWRTHCERSGERCVPIVVE
jgi:hypothetical protein